MAFDFGNAQGSEVSQNRLFKNGVKYSFPKADERRPITFRILPAFPEHEGELSDEDKAGSYVPAVTMIGGKPVVSDWIFALRVSRSYQKGAYPILSRTTLIEFDSDGTPVQQVDPLTQLHAFIRGNDKDWGYIAHDIGEWGSKDRRIAKLPYCRPEYVMNALTVDDDKPGVKLVIFTSSMAIADLVSTREGREGIAVKQKPDDGSESDDIFLYGDITDPNNAPFFKYFKGPSDDGGKKVYKIALSMETDPVSGRQRIEKAGLTGEMMALRQDLAHPETYVNVPTPEEQMHQIIAALSGRNDDGIHEYDLIRAAVPDFAYMVPEVPSAPGAVNQVQGARLPAAEPQPQPQPQRQFKPQTAAASTPRFKPAATQAKPVTQAKPASQPKAATASTPKFVPKTAGVARKQPAPKPPAEEIPEVPGEAGDFDQEDWVSQYNASQEQ